MSSTVCSSIVEPCNSMQAPAWVTWRDKQSSSSPHWESVLCRADRVEASWSMASVLSASLHSFFDKTPAQSQVALTFFALATSHAHLVQRLAYKQRKGTLDKSYKTKTARSNACPFPTSEWSDQHSSSCSLLQTYLSAYRSERYATASVGDEHSITSLQGRHKQEFTI